MAYSIFHDPDGADTAAIRLIEELDALIDFLEGSALYLPPSLYDNINKFWAESFLCPPVASCYLQSWQNILSLLELNDFYPPTGEFVGSRQERASLAWQARCQRGQFLNEYRKARQAAGLNSGL